MGLNGSIFGSFTMFLLLAISCGKRRCNYKEICHTYRDIILVELQSLNLTGSFNKEKHHCPSGKAHHVFRSIYSMTQQFWCHVGEKPQRDLEKVIESMEQVFASNCSKLVKKVCRRTQRKKTQRPKLINIINALIICWQKFQSMVS